MFARFVYCAAVATFPLLSSTAYAEERIVNVYNWSEYISKGVLEKFTQETGIKVKYETYDANEVLDAVLSTGLSGHDVVFPSASPFFAQQVRGALFQSLDRSKIPNATNLDSGVMAELAKVDPGNKFGVPYLAAATGIGYNIDKIKQYAPDVPLDSWRMMFDPAMVAKLVPCGVSILDTPTESVPIVQLLQGQDPRLQSVEALEKAMETLRELRSSIRYIDSQKYKDNLTKGEICMALGYIGELVQIRSNGEKMQPKQNIAVFIPKEGAIVNIDVMAIPFDAPHPDEAHTFINFILRPDIIAEITNEIGFPNAVMASLESVDPSIRNDPAIYPPPAVRAKMFSPPPPAKRDYDRLRSRAWAKFKALQD